MTFLFAKDLEQRFSYLDNPCRETGLRGAWITRPVLTVASSSRSTKYNARKPALLKSGSKLARPVCNTKMSLILYSLFIDR